MVVLHEMMELLGSGCGFRRLSGATGFGSLALRQIGKAVLILPANKISASVVPVKKSESSIDMGSRPDSFDLPLIT